ncbi:uncharacterized protein C8orf74 homolog [Fundulus heteroclitus]|uniref:uncharacterized protein C8orf74 homolog n=1 Tax=Fundulus heteroclitus TaxID=8078 RepID=UPI00165C567E|nr:uncharacterized protein C8orf74 homolog [Fundulus heteroclitus]
MDSLTEREIARIARLQRDAGIQRLSHHFQWPEFSNDQLSFHQEFVYDVAMFTTERGFSWADVIRSAALARGVFPQLHDFDIHRFWTLLRYVLGENLPTLTPVHRHAFTRYLSDTCISRRRLFQVVVGGAAQESVVQKQLAVQLPPTPCPLAQGTDLQEWEAQSQQRTRLASSLLLMEEKLRCLRAGPRVTLGDIDVPSDGELDKESIMEFVKSAVRTTQGQMLASLSEEASLLTDIHQLKLQQEALTTGGHQKTASSKMVAPKAKMQTAKTETGGKDD